MFTNQWIAVVTLLLAISCGCRPVPPELSSRDLPIEPTTAETDTAKLQQRIDTVLQYTLDHRKLNTQEHAAWQILHGSLAFGPRFTVQHEGNAVPVIEYLQSGGRMNGWTIQRGNRLQTANTAENKATYGMRAVVEPGTRAGQGHYDQWLAVISQCDVKPADMFEASGDRYTMTNFLQQVQLDSSRNHANEFSWTLIGLTAYYPTTHNWTDASGKDWSIEEMARIEIEQGLATGACGGTHRLIGLTMALNRHKAKGGKVEGVWADVEQLIAENIEVAKQYQNPNGALSVNYFARPGSSPDLANNLGTTGHTLEFLSIAMEPDDLKQPWVQRAASYLCEVFEKTQDLPLECGALYHAAHGLVLYRQRVYGEHDYFATPQSLAD